MDEKAIAGLTWLAFMRVERDSGRRFGGLYTSEQRGSRIKTAIGMMIPAAVIETMIPAGARGCPDTLDCGGISPLGGGADGECEHSELEHR
jgi:hypothetical protein